MHTKAKATKNNQSSTAGTRRSQSRRGSAGAVNLNAQPQPQAAGKVSLPYIFTAKNNSLDFIKDFSLINMEQALEGRGFDERVKLDYDYPNTKLADVISNFRTMYNIVFSKIRLEVYHDYSKYQNLQLVQPLKLINTTTFGGSATKSETLLTNLNQFLINVVEGNISWSVNGANWDVKVNLLPEAQIRLLLYASEINKDKYEAPTNLLSANIKIVSN